MSPGALAERRRTRLVRRAVFLRDVKIPNSRTEDGERFSRAELAAIRWALRVLDDDWDRAIELLQRADDAGDELEEDQ